MGEQIRENDLSNVSHVQLVMKGPNGQIVSRTYVMMKMTYHQNDMTVWIDNPTLFRCGFEP